MNKTVEDLLYEYPTLGKQIIAKNKELTDFITSKDEEYGRLGQGVVKFIPSGGDDEHNPVMETILRFEKHIQKLSDKVKELIDQKEYTEKLLEKLNTTETRIVELRYFQKAGWYTVSIKAHYNESWCKELHRRLLLKLKWWHEKTDTKNAINQ